MSSLYLGHCYLILCLTDLPVPFFEEMERKKCSGKNNNIFGKKQYFEKRNPLNVFLYKIF